jgi:preprotein translocase subunit SecG
LFGVLLTIHVLISLSLIITVLMQSAKGEGLAGAFGGGGISGAVFGGRGAATFLSKTTTVLAIAFMISCILLTFAGGGTGVTTASRISQEAQQANQAAQVTPMPGQGEGAQQGQQQAFPQTELEGQPAPQQGQPEGGQQQQQPTQPPADNQ